MILLPSKNSAPTRRDAHEHLLEACGLPSKSNRTRHHSKKSALSQIVLGKVAVSSAANRIQRGLEICVERLVVQPRYFFGSHRASPIMAKPAQ